MTKQQLKDELKQAMLSKDAAKVSAIRMVISALGYFEIQKGGAGYEATEEDVQVVIQKEAKQHRDSIEQFKLAGRDELVEKEEKELRLLEAFLPAQMSEEEVKKLVDAAVEKSGAASPGDIGKVMGILMPQVKGKADGGMVSKLVREALNKK